LQLISDKGQIIRFYLSLVRSVAYGESEVKLFARFIKASIISDSFYGEQKFTILADNAPLNNFKTMDKTHVMKGKKVQLLVF
jgi:hypothetical protein